MNFVQEAMADADAILLVTDLFETEFANTQVQTVARMPLYILGVRNGRSGGSAIFKLLLSFPVGRVGLAGPSLPHVLHGLNDD